ncbi:YhaN family protein [Telmatospirillum sp. J64-1]|uniref:ATP-binding protein n=1 Tax=Telmatospirillum sp. J64-1 TaxID=2502183 RepID=UPI00115F53A3|nr:YhaN family protein [Telmatospirillum sp. J64-1]
MRIERLWLERFGHFTEKELDFRRSSMHVLCGPNEAGKSTLLASLSDLFFGFGAQSPYAFLHEYKQLRLGAEIVAADGTRLDFRRRKGNQKTLLSPEGEVLDDQALAPFLGPVDRTFFETMFGLDHARLRRGGADILEAKGDLGRSLFEAGGGMLGLTGLQRRLDGEAADLFAPRKAANRLFYRALDSYNEARRSLGEAALRPQAWQDMQDRLAEAEARAEAARQRLAELEPRRARAERLRRVLPLLGELAQAERDLSGLAAMPGLPIDARDRRLDAQRRADLAGQSLGRAEEELARLTEEMTKLDPAAELLARGEMIHALFERGAAVRDQLDDLPKRRDALARARNELTLMLRRLGSSLPPERAAELVPSRADAAAIRALIAEEAALRGKAEAAGHRLAEAERHMAEAEAALAAEPALPDPAPLAAVLDVVKGRGPLESRLRDAALRAEQAQDALDTALAALPHWQGDAEALARLSLPDESTIERFETELAEMAQRRSRAEDERIRCRTHLEEAEAELARMTAAGDLPTADALETARKRRDAAWAALRSRIAEGGPFIAAEGDAYETLLHEADRLADRRFADAGRVARFEAAQQRHATAAQALAEADKAARKLEEAAKDLSASWSAAWAESGLPVRSPREMTNWLARRADILRRRETLKAADAESRALRAEIAESIAQLGAALAAAGSSPAAENESLAVLVARAESLLRKLTDSENRRRQAREKLDERRLALDEARRRDQACLQALQDWRNRWQERISTLGQRPDAEPAAVEEALGLTEEIDRLLGQIADLDHRIGAIGDNHARFCRDVADLLPEFGGDAATACAEAFDRLQKAKADTRRRQGLATRRQEVQEEIRKAQAQFAEARAELDGLCRAAGCAALEELPAAIETAEKRRLLEERREALIRQILQSGDGHSLEDLRAEAAEADPDALAAEIRDLAAAVQQASEDRAEAAGALTTLRHQEEEMRANCRAADAAQQLQEAVAEMRDVARRYGRLTAASYLLRRAIESYRQEQQGPLLARAGDIFRRLTGDSFAGLSVDYDERDQPVLTGKRPSGGQVPVEGMSEGSRDQLFLALRLAAIERYAEAAEPLPFVADDLLITFDDERALAALGVLRDLSKRVQVLFFTHHPHLADLAASRLGEDVTLHRLEREKLAAQ